jgi:ficolin
MSLKVVVFLSLLALGFASEDTQQQAAVVDAATAARAEANSAVATDAEALTEIEMEQELDAQTEASSNLPINCADAKVRGVSNRAGTTGSGVYRVKPLDGGKSFEIYCDMRTDGGGWNTFSRRFDGSVNFYRSWNKYKRGFGRLDGEHWLGLDKINRLSKTMPHKLRIELTGFDGAKKFGTWRTFMVDDEAHKYTLTARGFRDGGIGNSLRYHSGRPFSTYDRDNDAWGNNCASYFHGAWWYGACHHSNLNGKYYSYPGKHPNNYADGADWLTFRGHFESAKRVSMKFK